MPATPMSPQAFRRALRQTAESPRDNPDTNSISLHYTLEGEGDAFTLGEVVQGIDLNQDSFRGFLLNNLPEIDTELVFPNGDSRFGVSIATTYAGFVDFYDKAERTLEALFPVLARGDSGAAFTLSARDLSGAHIGKQVAFRGSFDDILTGRFRLSQTPGSIYYEWGNRSNALGYAALRVLMEKRFADAEESHEDVVETLSEYNYPHGYHLNKPYRNGSNSVLLRGETWDEDTLAFRHMIGFLTSDHTSEPVKKLTRWYAASRWSL